MIAQLFNWTTRSKPFPIPILMAPWGRNASTYLMSVFAAASEVYAPQSYPFESQHLLQFMRAGEVLAHTSPATAMPQSEMMPGRWDGLLRPFHDLPGPDADRGELACDYMIGLWETWISHLRRNGGIGGQVRYHAEKTTMDVVATIARRRTLFSLFIIRDPRDILASSRAFNRTRGNRDFGWHEGVDPSILVRRLISEHSQNLDKRDTLPDTVTRIDIRFEELVREEGRVLRKLSEILDIDLSNTHNRPVPEWHRTSDKPIGRWKHELPEAVAAQLRSEGADLLSRLGYA